MKDKFIFGSLTPKSIIFGSIAIVGAVSLTATSIIFGTKAYSSNKVHLVLYSGSHGIFDNGDCHVVEVNKGTRFKDLTSLPTPTCSEGYDFVYYLHDLKEEDFIINEDDYVIAIYTEHVSEAKNFATDNWATIANEANKGLDSLKKVYSNTSPFNEPYEYDPSKTNWEAWGSTFVIQDLNDDKEVAAKTRLVEISGYQNIEREDGNFTVSVIGERHDEVDENGNVATLTFQFNEILDFCLFCDLENYNNTYYSYKDGVEYSSYLRYYCNDVIYNLLPYSLKSNIQTVLKEFYPFAKPAANTPTISKERVFPLSLEELNFNINNEEHDIYKEGNNYAYYNLSPEGYAPTTRRRKKYRGMYEYYWTRSALINYTTQDFIINQNGNATFMDANDPLGICPAFCIGKSESKYMKEGCYIEVKSGEIEINGVKYTSGKIPVSFKSLESKENYQIECKIKEGSQFCLYGKDGIIDMSKENIKFSSSFNAVKVDATDKSLLTNTGNRPNAYTHYLVSINYEKDSSSKVDTKITFAALDGIDYVTIDPKTKKETSSNMNVLVNRDGDIKHYTTISYDYGTSFYEGYRGVEFHHKIKIDIGGDIKYFGYKEFIDRYVVNNDIFEAEEDGSFYFGNDADGAKKENREFIIYIIGNTFSGINSFRIKEGRFPE